MNKITILFRRRNSHKKQKSMKSFHFRLLLFFLYKPINDLKNKSLPETGQSSPTKAFS